MLQNDNRNETIRIFRKFARLGLVGRKMNPIQIYKKIEILCASRRSRLDMLAVFDTIRVLELNGEDEALYALFAVYLEGIGYRLTKNEISRRISCVARDQFCDERTVYRRLEKVRDLYERIRKKEGLITD